MGCEPMTKISSLHDPGLDSFVGKMVYWKVRWFPFFAVVLASIAIGSSYTKKKKKSQISRHSG